MLAAAQEDVDERWRLYEQLAGVERTAPHLPEADGDGNGHRRASALAEEEA
jgi:hypothetical protein